MFGNRGAITLEFCLVWQLRMSTGGRAWGEYIGMMGIGRHWIPWGVLGSHRSRRGCVWTDLVFAPCLFLFWLFFYSFPISRAITAEDAR